MKSPFSMSSSRSRVEGGALLVVISLLFVLAVVQHRWLTTIAESERLKLQEEATEKATAIARDVDRELTRAFLELRVDARTLERRDGQAFGERYERWRSGSAHPGLVQAVYVTETRGGEARLLRFVPENATLIETPWPQSLAAVRSALEPDSPGAPGFSAAAALPRVMADIPALISPVLAVVVDARSLMDEPRTGLKQIREMFVGHEGPAAVAIIHLDLQYLKAQLIGSLAASRLSSDGVFTWSAVSSGDGTVMAGATAPAGTEGDASAPLLRLRLDDLDQSLLRGVLPGFPDVLAESSVRVMVQIGGATPGGTASPHSGRMTSGGAPWSLVLRHRHGSIDAAVKAQQRRNAALSASILGVLGLSAGLVFFSSRRLRAIATQQVEFVAAVSHELRTPLAVIRSAADNLADGVVQEPAQARRYGALIRDESVRLTDMVEHVLEFAGADSPARAARGPIDVVVAIRAAMKEMEPLAADKKARITLDVRPTDEALRVNGDMSHLTRAVSNLLGNALKYGGEAPQVAVRLVRTTHGVEITVSDRGPGLSAAELQRLFEPFYRGSSASEAQIPGSGLGLALVRRIVTSHGGTVSASNQPEGGARLAIVLPSA